MITMRTNDIEFVLPVSRSTLHKIAMVESRKANECTSNTTNKHVAIPTLINRISNYLCWITRRDFNYSSDMVGTKNRYSAEKSVFTFRDLALEQALSEHKARVFTFCDRALAIFTVRNSTKPADNTLTEAPVILWWTSSFGEDERYRNCRDKTCYFTKERSSVENPSLRAIIFYGSNVELKDLPVPRAKNVRWALLHEESPRNNPMFVHQAALRLFNYSSTFSRYSDLPLTLLSLPGKEELLGTNYFLSVKEKNRLMATKNIAPVLYIQTNCDTASDRDSYVSELMKHVRVDSYGACLNNRPLPPSLSEKYIENLENEEFLRFVGQYKFTLAFENAVCDDYITEKLWRPLIVGSIPVYYGSPTFEDWLPNNKSAIAVKDFDGPRNLAAFLIELDGDDERYNEYLAHKLLDKGTSVNNDLILNELDARPKNLDGIFGFFVRSFECLVCEKLHDAKSVSRMTTKQYNCSLPIGTIAGKKSTSNSWTQQWMFEKCTAKLLYEHVSNDTKIDFEEFTKKAFKMYENEDCEFHE